MSLKSGLWVTQDHRKCYHLYAKSKFFPHTLLFPEDIHSITGVGCRVIRIPMSLWHLTQYQPVTGKMERQKAYRTNFVKDGIC